MELRNTRWIYVGLTLCWLLFSAWQYRVHQEARATLRNGLYDRAEDISRSIAVVIRADGRFSAVPQRRLEAALQELTTSTNLESVSLRDATGAVTAHAGPEPSVSLESVTEEQAFWLSETAVFVNLVALGPALEGPLPAEGPGFRGRRRADGRGRGERGPWRDHPWSWPIPHELREALEHVERGKVLDSEDVGALLRTVPGQLRERGVTNRFTELLTGKTVNEDTLQEVHAFFMREMTGRSWRGGGRGEEGALVDKRGIHAFVVEVPAREVYAAERRDRQTRLLLVGLSGVIALGMATLLYSLRQRATLGVRLARSEAMTTHLEELNTAAAGLVHETKNPLNVIRGLAQMLAQERGASGEGGNTATQIMEEADRVAGRLNQFLDYSRPLAPTLTTVETESLVADLASVLECDREEKHIDLQIDMGGIISVRADQDMLRQVLFNLLLNAIEAVSEGGRIEIVLGPAERNLAWLEVRDDGPGVHATLEDSLFQPYVTGTATGTGLGLTVVRQIALAHGWTVTYSPRDQGGSLFRVSGLELMK